MGFMRGSLSKSLFLLYSAAITAPLKNSAAIVNNIGWLKWYNDAVTYTLIVAAILQILKVCNKKNDPNTV